MKTTTFIYALIDPRNEAIRYIGKSDSPKIRFDHHLIDKKNVTHKTNWIQSLLKIGLKPDFDILDKVNSNEWQFWERHYISLYKSFGCQLTNLTDGGDGVSDSTGIVSNKISKKMKGRIITWAHKISIAQKGNKHTEEQNIAKSKRQKGIKKGKQRIFACNKCNKIYALSIITRLHNDKCTAEDRKCANPNCDNIFHVTQNKNKRIFCSQKCSFKHKNTKYVKYH